MSSEADGREIHSGYASGPAGGASPFPGLRSPPHVTVVAEAGSAHMGEIDAARKLIAAAKNAGADVVKFQAIRADEIVSPYVGEIELPGGPVNIYEKFRRLERPPSFYRELKEATEEEEEGEKHRALRTVHCKTVDQEGVDVHPSNVKLDLLEERRDLPNPATYFSNTVLTVPYEETLLPVVKRRLIRHLSSERRGNSGTAAR